MKYGTSQAEFTCVEKTCNEDLCNNEVFGKNDFVQMERSGPKNLDGDLNETDEDTENNANLITPNIFFIISFNLLHLSFLWRPRRPVEDELL